jgi:hypothetical protein
MACLRIGALALGCLLVVSAGAEKAEDVGPDVVERTVEGWTVRVERRLLGEKKEIGERALRLLEAKLFAIGRVVPEPALRRLREVTIWVGVEDPRGRHKCAAYHPSGKWLQEHGYDPRKAGCVDIANAETFLKWSREQPWMVLHELAHAYHHQVLGHDHSKLIAAYEQAVEGGAYESVLRYNGKFQRAYALNNVKEYFAEASEAFFGLNDYYPFVSAELKRHDPRMHALLREAWKSEY